MPRGVIAVLLAACGALAIVSTPASAGISPAAGQLAEADHDGDGVFDALEDEMAGQPSDDRFRVIVTLSKPPTLAQIEALQHDVGKFSVTHRFGLIDAFSGRLEKGQIRRLAGHGPVLRVEPDHEVHASNASAQQAFGVTEARIDAPGLDGDADGNIDAYSKNDLVAAVIDTGIHAGHRDLDEGKVLAFADFAAPGCNPCIRTPYDDHGHGTHVAATIAGEGDARADRLYRGVAPGAALVGVKVLDGNGNGSTSDVVAGIDWVVSHKQTYGIEALNLSLGAFPPCGNGAEADSLAVNATSDAGVVPLVAAGNDGPGRCTVGSPGAAAKAITVGAMADMPSSESGPNGFFQADFSSRGPTADGRIKPDVSAPGVSITSAAAGTSAGYATASGTSMATPFTAGVTLLMLDANPALTPAQVKAKVTGTAIDWARGGLNTTAGTTGQDIDYGFGRLDAYAALQSAGASIDSPPAVPTHTVFEGNLATTGAQLSFPINITDTRFPIAATMIEPTVTGGTSAIPNFNLALLNPSGNQVASATTNERQDELGFVPPATGTYTLRVTSAVGSGPFIVDLSAGTGSPPPPPPDTTPPTITSVSPADGATGIGTGANVAVTFSEPMNQSATQGAFTLKRTSDNQLVAGNFSWSGNTMMFEPSANLQPGTGYTATVTTAAKDAAGNALQSQRSWSFTTSSATTVTAFPSATTIEEGVPRSGSAAQLAADDNAYYEVNSSSYPPTSSWFGSFTGVPSSLSNLKVTYKGKNSFDCAQVVSIFRFSDSTWVQLDSRTVGPSEVELADFVPPGAASAYVGGPSGSELRVRVRCQASGFFGGSLVASGDLMKVTYAS